MYKIKNSKYFNSLVSYRQKMVMDLLGEFNRKGIEIVDNRNFGRAFGQLVDIPEMIKEGNMLKKFISKEDNEFMVLRIFAKCFGVSVYYFNIRVRLTGLVHNAIHAYYAQAIKFYDIQMLVRMSKDEQQMVLTKLLEVGNSSNRLKRAEFYRKIKKEKSIIGARNRTKVLTTDGIDVPPPSPSPSSPPPSPAPPPDIKKKKDSTPVLIKEGDVVEIKKSDIEIEKIEDNMVKTVNDVLNEAAQLSLPSPPTLPPPPAPVIEDISIKIQRNTEMEMIVPEGNVMGHIPMTAIIETGKKKKDPSATEIETWKMVNGY
jgi:hypothetical protein